MDEFSQILYWLEEAEQVLTELVEKGIDKGTGLVENNNGPTTRSIESKKKR